MTDGVTNKDNHPSDKQGNLAVVSTALSSDDCLCRSRAPVQRYARVPVTSLKPFSSYISSPSFVKTKFGLDSSKFDLLTVSPDKSAVAYVKNRLVYWKKGHEASISIGKVGEVRGFQWLSADSDTLRSKPTR
jgi:hypothetical protein